MLISLCLLLAVLFRGLFLENKKLGEILTTMLINLKLAIV